MNIQFQDEIRQLKTIAALYTKRFKYREAERVYKAVIAIQEKHLGEYSPELAFTYYQLAEIYTELGQSISAVPLFEQAVHIWEQLAALELNKPKDTVCYMDALVELQLQNDRTRENSHKIWHAA